MFKKAVFAGLGVALLASPLLVSADTLSDLQAQIQALLAQVRQLQEQLIQLQTPVIRPPAPPVETPFLPVCPIFTRTLAQGTTGDDVTQLQQYLGVSQTGFFGPMTAKAVAAFQADAGLTQAGIVGPQTRAWIYKRCGGGGWNQNFSASPTSGVAPLTVGFMGSIIATDYSLDFGDGSPVVGVVNQVECVREGDVVTCPQPGDDMKVSQTHTYTTNGTYTATLTYQPPMPQCSSGLACAQVMPAQQVRTVTISVGTQTSSISFSASPTSGTAPLAVSFEALNISSDYTLDFGDGQVGQFSVPECAPPPAGTTNPTCATWRASHTYTSNGTYTAKLMYQEPFVCNAPPGAACMMVVANPRHVGTVVVRVGTQTSNVTFSASPTSGTAPLAVTFQTFLGDEEGAVLDPGDGTVRRQFIRADAERATVVYTYTRSGTYIATVYKEDGMCELSGGTNCTKTGTATITVGGTISTGAPSVTGVDGPASLAVGQSGTWTVHASVPNTPNAQLRYSVIWGDEGVLGTLNAFAGVSAASTLQTSGSFTHIYARAGTYRPTFTVSNDFGSAQTSASVVVGKDTTPLNCPQYMPPLCNANESLVGGGYRSDGCQLGPRCVPKTSTSDALTASPTSGAAPLTVIFRTSDVNNVDAYSIQFGDGTSGTLQNNCAFGLGGCGLPTATHIYASAGTYTARLLQKSTCAIDTTCWIPVLGASSVTITVGAGGGASTCPAGGIAAAFGSCATYTSPAVYSLCPIGASVTVSGSCVANTYTFPTLNSCPAGTHLIGGASIGCVRDTQSSSAQSSQLASALTALESAIKAFIANLGQ